MQFTWSFIFPSIHACNYHYYINSSLVDFILIHSILDKQKKYVHILHKNIHSYTYKKKEVQATMKYSPQIHRIDAPMFPSRSNVIGTRDARVGGLILKPFERKHPEAKRPTGVTPIRLTHRVESMRF